MEPHLNTLVKTSANTKKRKMEERVAILEKFYKKQQIEKQFMDFIKTIKFEDWSNLHGATITITYDCSRVEHVISIPFY